MGEENERTLEEDFDGHEKYENKEDMYNHYNLYYAGKVKPDTIVKIIQFYLL